MIRGDRGTRADASIEPMLLGIIAAALAIGCLGAFSALGRDGFWADELFTAWVIGNDHDLSRAAARMLTDTHPPLYYLTLFGWSRVAGTSESSLRLFSAITATTAIVLFVAATRASFSLPARLFAAAVATTSNFWIYQSQNARSYGLALLIATALVVFGLAIPRAAAASRTLARRIGLIATVALGAFVHFYLLVTGLVLLVVLFVTCPRHRLFFAVSATAIAAMSLAWIKLVVASHSIYRLGSSWIKSSPGWYVQEVRLAIMETFNPATMLALAVALVAAAVMRRRPIRLGFIDPRSVTIIVPPLVLLAGIGSSIVLAPNLTDRNLLVASPFVWGALAWSYDAGIARLDRWRIPTTALLTAFIVVAAFRAERRFDATNEPFRESASWISAQPGCSGATVTVIDPWLDLYRNGQGVENARHLYGHYLHSGIRLRPVRDRDVAQTTMPQTSCNVVAWEAHSGSINHAETLRQALAARLHAPVALKVFPVARDAGGFRAAYVFVRLDNK